MRTYLKEIASWVLGAFFILFVESKVISHNDFPWLIAFQLTITIVFAITIVSLIVMQFERNFMEED